MLWRNPIDLGGNVRGTPAIAGWTSRSVFVAVGGPSGNVKLGWRDENGWGGLWEDIGLPTADAPAIAFVDDAPYIFVRGLNGHLWVGGTVAVARDLGGDVQSAPSVAQWRLDHDAHIFVRNAGNTVSHFMWSPGTSGHWQSIGGQILGSPAAVAWGPDRLDVVAQSADTLGLVHCSWDGKNWSNWEDRGGVLDGAPCVVSRDIGQLEVYYNDSNTDQLTTRSFDGVNWSNAKAIGPATEGTPTAFSFGPHHVEVLSKSTTGSLILAYQEGARPGDDPAGSPPAAGPFANSPSATATATTIMHCVARGENGYLRHIKYEDGFWGNWSEFRDIQIVGDPVIVCPLPGVLDLVVQVSGNEILGNRILRRRFTGGVWSAWSDTFGRTRDHIAALVQVDGTTHFLVRGTDNHLYEGVVNLDGTWAPWRDLGGTMLSRPHVIEVREIYCPGLLLMR